MEFLHLSENLVKIDADASKLCGFWHVKEAINQEENQDQMS